MKEIKEAGSEIGLGLLFGLGSLGFFLMFGMCTMHNPAPRTKTDFQYCYSLQGFGEESTRKKKEECFKELKSLNKTEE